jgi:hypothetical protein
VSGSREDSHALFTEVLAGDEVVNVPIKRGDITVHNESVSASNTNFYEVIPLVLSSAE